MDSRSLDGTNLRSGSTRVAIDFDSLPLEQPIQRVAWIAA